MGRQIGSMAGCLVLLAALGACAVEQPTPSVSPVKTYPTGFSVPDPVSDAESTAEGLVVAPNVDLTAIAVSVSDDGVAVRFSYARDWTPHSTSRWGIRFEIRGSDGSRLSGAWTQDPGSPALSRRVDLAPRRAGCAGSVRFLTVTRRLFLTLSRGCLPRASARLARRWIRFETIGSVSSWHSGPKILYAWDQLYARVVAPEPERLYLPD